MNETTLKSKLDKLGVNPPDLLRTALYLAQLERAADVFGKDLRANESEDGFGGNYWRVEPALADPMLLTQLAQTLDTYVLYAVIADLINGKKIQNGKDEQETVKNFIAFQKNQDAYRQYFQEQIFGISESHFQNKLDAFYDEYPRTKYAIEKVTSSFTNNVTLACTRIIKDWDAINNVFAKTKGYELRRLAMIKSSGSDFHKGGQQVLILTLKVFERGKMRYMPLNLIYKPADIEADCLLIGDSAAVNSVHQGFMGKSLMEILNTWIELELQNNPQATFIKLPTYKILPFTFGSSAQAPAIKDSYGYIEFLHHKELKTDPGTLWSAPSINHGDFVIRPAQDKGAICRKFYCLIGQICAIATTFSFGDLHFENLIVHQYQPYLIDLENSLSKPMANIKTTGLLMEKKGRDFAAITGINGQTRLMIEEGTTRKLINPKNYAKTLISGLGQMMELIGKNVRNADITTWFARLKGVIVRQVPISTKPLAEKMKSLFSYQQCNKSMESFDADIAALFRRFEDQAFAYWLDRVKAVPGMNPNSFKTLGAARQQVFWKNKIFPDPIFFALNEAYLKENYQNLDVPVYYHRIGENDLLDYNGKKLTVGPSPYVLQEHYQEFLAWVGNDKGERLTYFPLCFSFPNKSQSYPTEQYIKLWQFDKLADQTYFDSRVNALTDEIKAELQPPQSLTTRKALQQINVKTVSQ